MRYDIYRAPHKGQRRALFLIGIAIGRLNPADETAAGTLRTRIQQLLSHIRDHSASEDRFVAPLYQRVGYDTRAMDASHATVERLMDLVLRQLDEGALLRAEHNFYRLYHRLAAEYLVHLDDEETAQAEQLWPRLTDDELIEAQAAFVASRPPMNSLSDLAIILPSLNVGELVAFLTALKRDVPAEPFGMIAALARRSLEPEVWSAVESRLKQW